MINYFYGQFNPPVDYIIRTRYFLNQDIGNCIEIGAVDGIMLSNTYHFEQNGWNSLCIEPIPSYYEILKNNRKNTLNYAISSNTSDDMIFNLVSMNTGNRSSISGLELDTRLVDLHQQMNLNPKIETIKVKSRRLDWCIENHFNHETIDFISIDTEGSELDVLKSFNVNNYNIKLLVIENNYNDSIIEEYLKDFGWIKDIRVEVNDFYIRSKND
jgi:FkbM family methyltransferase